jgi:PAS domain S-box-containing protein
LSWHTVSGRVTLLALFSVLGLLASVSWVLTDHRTLISQNELPEFARKSLQEFDLYLMIWATLCVCGVTALAIGLIQWYSKYLQRPTQHLQSLAMGVLSGPLPVGENELAPIVHAANQLSENVVQASSFAKSIGEGNLQVAFQPVSQSDALGNALVQMRQRLLQVAGEDKKRNWTTEGLASFAELLRMANQNRMELADRITAHLVNHVGANQGGLFVVEENGEEARLALAACFAYDRKKFIQKHVLPGEGLIGQCYLEKETIYLTDVPENYVQITSGLGQATPRCLLLVPLKLNDAVEGVIELASFHPFESHQIQFVEKVGESIAGTLASAKITDRTRQLLEDAQQQAEEMRAQEEEMRQNMEELQATQEEMHRKEKGHLVEIERLNEQHQLQTASLKKNEAEMTGVLTAINSTLASIEFDTQGHVLTANPTFLQAMGYTLEEIKGQHHRIFADSSFAQSEAYAAFWNDLNQGKTHTGEMKRVAKSGKEVWFSASYTPVLNEEGKLIKIIKFAQDITEQKFLALDHQCHLDAISKSNATIEFDLDGHILHANSTFLKLMGYEETEIIGHHHRMFITEREHQSEEYARFWEVLRLGEFVTGEFQRVDKHGNPVWIKGSYNAILDPNGQPYKVVKYAQDTTAAKLMELESQRQAEELRAQEEELRQNMEELNSVQEEIERKALLMEAQAAAINSTMATIEFDLKGTILMANSNFLQLMGYQMEEVSQQSHALFVGKEYARSEDYARFWEELRSGKPQVGKVKRITKDGKAVWLNASYTPVFDRDHQPVKILKLALLTEN